MTSILGRVRDEATQEANERWRHHINQIDALRAEEAEEASTPPRPANRLGYWLFGFLCGATYVISVRQFFP